MTDVCQNTQDWSTAIDDANKCISIKPGWGKGYGAALHGAGDLEGALKAYKDGLAVEPGANLTTSKTCFVTFTVVLLTSLETPADGIQVLLSTIYAVFTSLTQINH